MWHVGAREWTLHRPRFLGAEADPERAAGPWFGHRWFVYDLIRWGSPDVVVELGTHYGVSFFAMCQAVLDGALPIALHAVDTWEGDEHAGFYGDEVIEIVRRIRGDHYADLDVTLHRSLFSDALDSFADGSVDLLHIDGFHSYEAAREDYETWYPKLAPNGIVLFHDVAEATGYGSADYWNELSPQHPAVTFLHSCGLGVLAPKGTAGIDFLFGPEFARWASYYEARAGDYLGALATETQTRMIDDRDEALRATTHRVDELLALVREQEVSIGALHAEIAERERERSGNERELAAGVGAVRGRGARAVPAAAANAAARLGGLRARLTGGSDSKVDRALRQARDVTVGRVRSPVPTVFDPAFYRITYADVRRARLDPLPHFRRHGWREQRDPNPLFDTSWYLAERPDVVVAGVDPFRHYLVHGWREGADPSPIFDGDWYLAHRPDAREAGVSPLEHYWTTGFADGAFVHPAHRRRVLAVPGEARVPVRDVTDVTLSDPTGAERAVTLDDLVHADVDLVTFDVWDTLVARSRPADGAKLATARRIVLAYGSALPPGTTPWSLMAARVAVEAAIAGSTDHEEYRLDDVLARLLVDVAGLKKREAHRVAADLAVAEAREEAATTYPVDAVAAFLEEIRTRPDPPKVAVVSDFYIGADGLREVLAACGYPADLVVYVSCDLDRSKRRDGRLFEHVRRELGVAADRHLHVGDNPHADHHNQVATGGWSALLALTSSGYPGPGALDPDHVGDLVDGLTRELRVLQPVVVGAGEVRDVRAGQAGVATALLPVALVAAAIEEAVARGLDRVCYLSREGAFLRRVHDVVAPALVGPGAPVAVHLPCSRRATFVPSLAAPYAADLRRMWSQYASQSPRALFTSLGLDPDGFAEDLTAVGLALDATVEGIADDPRVAALLDRPGVVARIDARIAEQRSALDRLLADTVGDAEAAVVVDVGWRGTIQDNLARIRPGVEWIGCYLGLFPFLNPQPANTVKRGVAFDANAGDEYAFADPPAAVEAPWTPDVASAVGYSAGAEGVEVVHEAEGPRAAAAIAAFQDAVVAVAPTVARWMVVNGLTTPMLQPALGVFLREYYEQPPGGVADIWFDSTHDDTFGALNVGGYGKRRPPRSILADAASAGADLPHAPTPEEAESRWAAGYRAWLPVRALTELRALRREQP